MNTRFLCVWLSCLVLAPIGARARAEVPEVPVARALVREVTDSEDFTGRTEAVARVDLRARVTGYLLKAAIQEGAEFKKGDVLFEIDPQIYQAELDKAEAALKLAAARLKLAEINHKKVKARFEQKTASQEELDGATAERLVAEGEVRAAKAAHGVYRLYLDFTKVLAPMDGRIGRRAIDPGNLVVKDETLLATLVSRDPVYVYFDVDERSVLRLRRSVNEEKGKAGKVSVAVGLADEDNFPRRGVVDLTDNQVNADTGTLRMRAVLSNKDGLLLPGLFVRVRLALGAPYKALTVPEQAVMVEDEQKFVYVVNDKDVVERRAVAMGQKVEDRRVVTRGLKADERVVVGRLSALRPGMTVRPREQEKPPPKPKQSSGGPSLVPSAGAQGGLGVLVETVYPGANAQVVSDTVRSPIEQQVNGMENLRLMRSRCTSDGRYALALSFARGANMNLKQVLAQNRVSLATPALPAVVQNGGVSVLKGTFGAQAVVLLSAPDGEHDRLFLGNYANTQIKLELARLPGVGSVALLGQSDYGLRIWLDPNKLAARGLNAGEVTRTIEKQKEIGGMDVEKLSALVVKADGDGRIIYLKDVAKVELGAGRERSRASFNGKPVAALIVRPYAEIPSRQARAALRDAMARLRERLPKGLDLTAPFDFTTDAEYLLLDLDVPASASSERVEKMLSRCAEVLRQVPGVRDVLAMSENPFDLFGGGPCILVGLSPAEDRKAGREEIARTMRAKLDEIKELSVRVRDLSPPIRPAHFGYPIDLAVRGPELGRVREFAKELAARLSKDKKLTDVWADPASTPRLQRTVDIDRTAAAMRGVSLDDILATIRVHAGPVNVNDFVRFGRTWSVQVRADSGSGDWIKDLGTLPIRGARGQMIPLNVLVKVRQTDAPLALDFLDFFPMVQITANPASGVKRDEARKLCETLAEEVRKELRLPAEYRLRWLP